MYHEPVIVARSPARLRAATAVLAAAAIVAALGGRWVSGWQAPLSFDETFAGVIASQRDTAGLLRWCLAELTGPAYYMPLWAWARVAGDSDVALRVPSLALSLAAPALIAWRGHPDRRVRWWWAVLALLWLPGLSMASEARPYAQLFALGCGQAIAFRQLLSDPTRPRAALWVAVSAAMVLTHYYAVPICAAQGFAFVALRRRKAVRCWPAALLLVPVAAWMAVHLPTVLAFAGAPGTHYTRLGPADLTLVPMILIGSVVHGTIVLGLVAWLIGRGRVRWPRPELAVALTGAIAFAAVLALGFVRPSFAPRYLTPAVPAILFGLAWLVGRSRDRLPAIVLGAMLALTTGGIIVDGLRSASASRAGANLEEPSAWLGERRVDTLIFFWDSAIGAYAQDRDMAEVASFVLRRAGQRPRVIVAHAAIGLDANAAVFAAAGDARDVGVIWRTSDIMFGRADRRPALERRDPRFECRDFGPGMVACRRR